MPRKAKTPIEREMAARKREPKIATSNGLEVSAKCRRCDKPRLEQAEICQCLPTDDSITAAKLRAAGWQASGSIFVNRTGIATLWFVLSPTCKSLWIGGTWDRSWEIRTVTGWSDLCELVRVLRGEK